MDVDSILKRFEHFGVDLSLKRIQQLLADLGNPHQQVPIIHVAGSNGKGSVCAYLSAVLTTAGYRVGRYTSPHLVDWTERIHLNEKPISTAALLEVLQQVVAGIRPDQPSPTQFEAITAAAWLYFAQQEVDIAVVEVGLGGRLDATNVCDRPLVTIITSISWEHWQKLGPTLGHIAAEKAGILKPGCPAVIGPLPPEAEAVITQRIKDLGCPSIWPEPAQEINREPQSRDPRTPRWMFADGIEYPLPLPGDFQRANSALAIAALQILRQQGWEISDHAIAAGMANTQWPGRMQWSTWRDRPLLIDGAHNAGGATVLRHYVDSLNLESVTWVMGILATKDPAGIFTALLRPGDTLYLVPVPDHISNDPEELVTLAPTICSTLTDCRSYSDVFTALDAAVALPVSAQKNLMVLCGSLYLIGHFFAVTHSCRENHDRPC